MLIRTLMILTASFAIGGCSTMGGDFTPTGRQAMKNAEGHVVGYKQMLRNQETGEVSAQVQLFTPVKNAQGEIVAYEERSGENSIIRGVDGRQIGTRFNDVRSRGTNAKSKGITLIIGSLDTRRVVTDDKLSVREQLFASLTSEELSAIR